MSPETRRGLLRAQKAGGDATTEAQLRLYHTKQPLTRTSRELTETLARLEWLASSTVPPAYVQRHCTVIAEHVRAELQVALEVES
jgi:hypothetical protein